MAFSWPQSTYAKIIIGSVVGFLGIALGIYTGFAFTDRRVKNPVIPVSRTYLGFERHMKIIPGDKFPSENYTDSLGNTYGLDSLIKGKDALLIFSLWGCAPCQDFIRDAREKMTGHFRAGTVLVHVVDRNQPGVESVPIEIEKGFELVFVDWDHWKSTHDLFMWPTIIGVDYKGTIKHVQFGYDGSIDEPLAKYFLEL